MPTTTHLKTQDELQPLINSGRLLRIGLLFAIAVQQIVNWAVPMLVGGASETQRAIVGLAASSGSESATRTAFGIYALVVGLGHIGSLVFPRIQTAFGVLHAISCVVIGARLIQVGLVPAGITYAFGWSSLGVFVSITAERRRKVVVA